MKNLSLFAALTFSTILLITRPLQLSPCNRRAFPHLRPLSSVRSLVTTALHSNGKHVSFPGTHSLTPRSPAMGKVLGQKQQLGVCVVWRGHMGQQCSVLLGRSQGSCWVQGRGSPNRGWWAWNSSLPRAMGMAPSCQSSSSIQTPLSHIAFGFWMLLCGARGRSQCSLWVPCNLLCSVLLWFYGSRYTFMLHLYYESLVVGFRVLTAT